MPEGSCTLKINPSSIKHVGESVGVRANDEIATKLAEDVEFRMREVIQEAIKFMRHAKRTRLKTVDINNALRVLNVEPLYGFNASEPQRWNFHKATADIYTQSDKELPIETVLSMDMPPCPWEPSLACHWLAVEGVQPAIPQNPAPNQRQLLPRKRKADGSEVEVKPIVKHVLTKELQLFFQQAIKGIRAVVQPPAVDSPLKEAVLTSLASDPGLHQLLPYLSQFFADEVMQHLRDLPLLTSLLRMVWSLLQNQEHMHVEPYLHQWMPVLLTCLLGKRLCVYASEDHWRLRDFAAQIIARICERYGTAYSSMQPRITRTLIRAFLDPLKPLTTHYGAVVGLAALGPTVLETLLMPHLLFYTEALRPNKDESRKPSPVLTPEEAEAMRAGKKQWKDMSEAEQQEQMERNCPHEWAWDASQEKPRNEKILEQEKVMGALQAAAGQLLQKRPEALAKTRDASKEGMPTYDELVELFGEGLQIQTMKTVDLAKTWKIKPPSVVSGKPVCKKGLAAAPIRGGCSIASLVL